MSAETVILLNEQYRKNPPEKAGRMRKTDVMQLWQSVMPSVSFCGSDAADFLFLIGYEAQ